MCLPAAATDGLALTTVLHDWAGADGTDDLSSWTMTPDMNMSATTNRGTTFCCPSHVFHLCA